MFGGSVYGGLTDPCSVESLSSALSKQERHKQPLYLLTQHLQRFRTQFDFGAPTPCQQEPAYRREVRDGIINFVPTQSTDQFVSKLLDTRVSSFAPEKGLNKFGLRNVVANLPEVKSFLDVNDVTVSRLEYPTYSSVYSNGDLDLSISNTNVRRVLNKIIRDSEHKLWIIKRSGEKMRTVQISL